MLIANSGHISINVCIVQYISVWSRSSSLFSTSIQRMHNAPSLSPERKSSQNVFNVNALSHITCTVICCHYVVWRAKCALLAPLVRCSSSRQTKSQFPRCVCVCVMHTYTRLTEIFFPIRIIYMAESMCNNQRNLIYM